MKSYACRASILAIHLDIKSPIKIYFKSYTCLKLFKGFPIPNRTNAKLSIKCKVLYDLMTSHLSRCCHPHLLILLLLCTITLTNFQFLGHVKVFSCSEFSYIRFPLAKEIFSSLSAWLHPTIEVSAKVSIPISDDTYI